MRGRVWPLLLGVDVQLSPEAEAEYLELRCAKHRDSSVVECDVQRSLWTYTDGEQALDCLCLCCILLHIIQLLASASLSSLCSA